MTIDVFKKWFYFNSLNVVIKVDIKSWGRNYQGMVNCGSRNQEVPQEVSIVIKVALLHFASLFKIYANLKLA